MTILFPPGRVNSKLYLRVHGILSCNNANLWSALPMPYSIIISKMSTTLNLNKPLRIHNLYTLHISSRNTLTARLKFLITRTTSETFATFFFQECQYASLVESIILTWCVTLVYAGSGISVQNTLLLIKSSYAAGKFRITVSHWSCTYWSSCFQKQKLTILLWRSLNRKENRGKKKKKIEEINKTT